MQDAFSMSAKGWVVWGALLGGLAVLFGAFGAHGLSDRLQGLGYQGAELAHRLENYEVAARYQMYHALALLAVGLYLGQAGSGRLHQAAGWAFLLGVVLFSGLLYVLVFAGKDWSDRRGLDDGRLASPGGGRPAEPEQWGEFRIAGSGIPYV